jgi:hypothetical protein
MGGVTHVLQPSGSTSSTALLISVADGISGPVAEQSVKRHPQALQRYLCEAEITSEALR